MCGRFTLRTNIHQVAEFLQAPLPGFDIRPRYNVSPGQMVVAVRSAEQRDIVQLKWGLIPTSLSSA
jgi:putative SOS response-associated peptidase YedK